MLLRRTKSICPVCMKVIDAQVNSKDEDVYLDKTCPEHGSWSTVIWRGNNPRWEDWVVPQDPDYVPVFQKEVSKGCPYDCGICPEHQAPTCSILMEITQRCNLGCPICFAQSRTDNRHDVPMDEIKSLLQSIINAGGPYPLQLSGGEPTVRNDLPEIITLAKSMGFKHVQINTNGIRIADDIDYLASLKQSGADLIYLQLDGISDEVYMKIRGRRLSDIKRKALENCRKIKIGVQLVPTIIRGVNDHEIGDIVRLAKEFMPIVRGIHFQPVSFFGRFETSPDNENRETLPDVMHALEAQTNGELKINDFLPRSKHDAHCGFSAFYILNEFGTLKPATHFDPLADANKHDNRTAAEHVRDFITNKSRYDDRFDRPKADCTKLEQSMARAMKYSLSISGMPFQDAWTLDIERVKNCCIHVISQDGSIIPFCANYVTNTEGKNLLL